MFICLLILERKKKGEKEEVSFKLLENNGLWKNYLKFYFSHLGQKICFGGFGMFKPTFLALFGFCFVF